jgi:hypothetical protein
MTGAAHSYFWNATVTGNVKVLPWHAFCDARLMEAAPARSTLLEPAGTEIDGLEGNTMLTPLVVHDPLEALIDPPDVMAIEVRVTE